MKSILLVDDEPEILSELAELLEAEGLACLCAQSVAQAMQQLAEQPNIGLVITDLRMPDESGLRLIQRLRSHPLHQQLPIIVTSGHACMDDVVGILRLGVVDFLPKPIYQEYLLEKITALFTSQQLKAHNSFL